MSTSPRFSVVIPCFNRGDKLKRTLRSLDGQSFKDFEVVMVNDGSTDNTKEVMEKYAFKYLDVKVINHAQREERVASRNDGMKAASGEWICWLDSDDEYFSNTLEVLNDAIETFPDYQIFNYGSIIQWHRKKDEFITKIGATFKPETQGKGHVSFKSGFIGTGRFIFKRSLLRKIPPLIPSMHPYGNPGCFPELNRNPEYPMREDGQWIPFGNPWGEDWLTFWNLTRNHQSKPLDMLLYIEHRRAA